MIPRAVAIYFLSVMVLAGGVIAGDDSTYMLVATAAMLPGIGYAYGREIHASGRRRVVGIVCAVLAFLPIWSIVAIWVRYQLTAALNSQRPYHIYLMGYLVLAGAWIAAMSKIYEKGNRRA